MTQGKGRLVELDLFKSLLVVGMISTHVLQLLSRSMPGWTDRFAEFINLVTFSGFLLAMGIGLGLAGDRTRPWRKRLWPVLLLVGASYLSSFAFALLVDREKLTGDLILDVLTMRRLFGWSEFLASFAVLYAAVAVGRALLVWLGSNPVALALASALCLLSSWVVLDREVLLLATLIGTNQFASFPLLPYLPWFLLGIALGRTGGRVTAWHWTGALLATGWLLWGMVQTGELPGRFPPTVSWIVGPALVLLMYLEVARRAAHAMALPGWITVPGRHVLSLLLVSNLMIFALRNLYGRPVLNIWAWLGVSGLVLAVIGGGWLVWEGWRRASRGPDRNAVKSSP